MIHGLFTSDLWLLLLIQGTACLAAGLAASYALRRRPARAHQVLCMALLAAVLMPGLYLSARRFGLGVLAAPGAPSCSTPAPGGVFSPAEGIGLPNAFFRVWGPGWDTSAPLSTIEITDESAPVSEEPVTETPAWGTTAACVPWALMGAACWLAATAVLLGRLFLRFALGFHLLRAADPVETTQVNAAIEKAKSRLGIDAPIRIRRSHKVRSPVIWCWVRDPVLLVHQDAENSREAADWVGVFCHELAHWRRRDHLTGLFAELLVAMLPWHPLLWWAKGRLLKLSEAGV